MIEIARLIRLLYICFTLNYIKKRIKSVSDSLVTMESKCLNYVTDRKLSGSLTIT